MEKENSMIFQTDSRLVIQEYENNPNYLIEYDSRFSSENICAIYFSSHDIYYPNKEEVFVKNIIERNKFEWYNTRIENASKHIFIRDIKKQWYISGLNKIIDSPIKLLEFLQIETNGYRIITIGSSAGGFASVLFGSLLDAEKIFSFNGQFEISSLLRSSHSENDPLVFKYADDSVLKAYYDTKSYIKNKKGLFYFVSYNSPIDKAQYEHIKDLNLNSIIFKTNHHGIPFPKDCLTEILKLSYDELANDCRKSHSPIIYAIHYIGIYKTISGLSKQLIKRLKK